MKSKKGAVITTLAVFLAALMTFAVLFSRYRNFQASVIDISYLENTQAVSQTSQTKSETPDYDALAADISAVYGAQVTAEALKNLGDGTACVIRDELAKGEITNSRWHKLTGLTFNAFLDKYITKKSIDKGSNGKSSFTLGFTGDINFTETGYVMTHAYNVEGGVAGCIDEKFQEEMRSADIMMINNEFPYSDRGSPIPDKKYTFRARPAHVHYLNDFGVDLAGLANNHAYDYGYDSFVDTLKTLSDAGIPYVGAGMNIEEASAPVSFIINGYKVSYIACSGVESPIKTPVATEDSCGIFGSYDGGSAVAEAVSKAKQESDYVIVFPHWGYENTTQLTNAQYSNSKLWIDSGADAVIGCHAHILQGMQFYNGKPVIYGLGNFWFNTRSVSTGLLKLVVREDGFETIFVPGMQSGSETHYISDPEAQRRLFDEIEGYEPYHKVKITDEGAVLPAGD